MRHELRSSFALRCITILLAGFGLLALSGCGQKGPLTLPKAAASASPATAASAAAR